MTRQSPTTAPAASPATPAGSDRPTLRTALIGYGGWGPNVARNVARLPGCRLDAIAELSAARLQIAQADHAGARAHSDWTGVMRDPAIDAVLIATPADTHFAIALSALYAGKHVFVEKPMAASSLEARRLVDEAARHKRVLMVDHTYVFSPPVRAIARTILAGAIGRPLHYVSRRFNAAASRRDAPVHWDLAAHDLAILGHLFGEEPLEVAATRLGHDAVASADAVRIELAWRGSFTASLEVRWNAPAKVRHVSIAGTVGQIDYADLEPVRKVRVRAHGGEVAPVLETTEPLLEAVRHFVACIEGREAPLAGGRTGLQVVRTLEAVDRSLAGGGRRVALAPEAAAA